MDQDGWSEFECPTLGLWFSLKDAYLAGLVKMETMQGLIIECPYCEQAHFYSSHEWYGIGE